MRLPASPRDEYGSYTPTWYLAGALSIFAAFISLRIAAARHAHEPRRHHDRVAINVGTGTGRVE